MINNTEHVLGPEDILEMDILPNLPNSAGYQNIVTMIDVFSRYYSNIQHRMPQHGQSDDAY